MKLLRIIREVLLFAVWSLVAIGFVYFLCILFWAMRCH